MKDELFTIGPFTVYGYGTMIAIGILAAYIMTEYRARKCKLPYEHVFSIVIWCTAGGFISSKLLFWLTEWKEIVKNPAFMLETLGDGFVVYGGILGGILAGYCYCRIKKLEFLKFFDLVMPSIALAQGFGRIGCLLAGCCYGKETSCSVSIVFHNSGYAPNGVSLVPTQIYSSILDFLHCGVLLLIARKKGPSGMVAACYLIFYSIGRFILEYFRGDLIRGSVGSLSTSQFISIFTGSAGVCLLMWAVKRNKREQNA